MGCYAFNASAHLGHTSAIGELTRAGTHRQQRGHLTWPRSEHGPTLTPNGSPGSAVGCTLTSETMKISGNEARFLAKTSRMGSASGTWSVTAASSDLPIFPAARRGSIASVTLARILRM